VAEVIGRENIFIATPVIGETLRAAIRAAETRVPEGR
jgi:hypothetical protein